MSGKHWTKVTAHLDNEPDDWSVLHEAFAQNGLDGTVQTDDPPTIGSYAGPGHGNDWTELREALMRLGANSVTTETIPEEDWANAWRQFFKPTAIGPFMVRPTWEEADPNGLTEIVLDPGQAFGTGDHPTTRMCLILLQNAVVPGCSAADIGCGSGILSIAVAKLGGEVVAVDIDPDSVEATAANAETNAVTVPAFRGEGFAPVASQGPFDLVLSNIISAALIRLATEAWANIRPGGTWIVSGIIQENWPDVLAAALGAGFSLSERLEEGEWVAATLKR